MKPLCESPNYALIDKYRDLTHVEGDGSAEKILECNIVENPDASSLMFRGGWMATNVISWRVDDLPAAANIMGVPGGWAAAPSTTSLLQKCMLTSQTANVA